MLQMTSMELNELIEQELVANPVLEEVLPGEEVQEISENILDQNSSGEDEGYTNGTAETLPSSDASAADDQIQQAETLNGFDEHAAIDLESGDRDSADVHESDPRDSFEEIDYGREFQDYLDPGYRTQEIEYKDDAPSFEQFLSHTESLSEHLEWQLNMLDIGDTVREAAVTVVGNLDEDGRLTASNADIAAMCGCSEETVEKARSFVMNLEPVGCGARDDLALAIALKLRCEVNSLAIDGEYQGDVDNVLGLLAGGLV